MADDQWVTLLYCEDGEVTPFIGQWILPIKPQDEEQPIRRVPVNSPSKILRFYGELSREMLQN